MIRHIVFFKLKEDKRSAIDELERRLKALSEIDLVKSIQVGRNFKESDRSMDLVLETSFSSKEDLAAYAGHQKHLPVLDFVRDVCSETKVVDYEI